MKIIIRPSAQRYEQEINQAIEAALGFLTACYGWHFDNVELYFSTELKRSTYWPNENNSKFTVPNALIQVETRLSTYSIKTLGVAAHNLPVGIFIATTCNLIHELTHHVQYNTNRKTKGEMEPTWNELRWLTRHDPEWKKFLTKLK